MGFAGNLRTLSLVEVFQTLNRIQATGVLRLVSGDGGRDVVFDKGEIIGVGFRAGEEGQALLRRLITTKVITPEDAASISSDGRSENIAASLIDAGVVTAADVDEARERQAIDELHNLFTWDFADFVFHDAGPGVEDINGIVDLHRGRPLQVVINSLLMESARRSDEWSRLRQVILDDDVVLGPAQGSEGILRDASADYPASAIVPLVDGVRTVGEIVKASVATRFDIFSILVELINDRSIVPLTREDLVYHGDYLVERGDHQRAAMVYRRALAEDPADVETTKKLAACLEKHGDNPTAAGCQGQLALAMLADGRADQAAQHARKAVALAPADPQLRLTLVRCLLGDQDNVGAVAELKQLAGHYLQFGQLEDARGTCLKIIEINPQDEDARRELARIYSQAENDPSSEDVVVCVSCGHVNHREAASCAQCKTALHLTCINCGRVVGVSDRICIFCGANPHIVKGKGAVRREAGGTPTTSRIAGKASGKGTAKVDPAIAAAAGGATPGGPAVDEKGHTSSLQRWRNRLEECMAKARHAEDESRWADALGFWREVAKIQPDSPDLQARIRELEQRIHDEFVESEIERGHRLKKLRRYWGAGRAYKNALHLMAVDDPRAERLLEILKGTQRKQQQIAVIYAAGLLFILAGLWLAVQPWVELRTLTNDAAELSKRIQQSSTDVAMINRLRPEIEAIQKRPDAIRRSVHGRAMTVVEGVNAEFKIAVSALLKRRFDEVDEALERNEPERASEIANDIRNGFPDQTKSLRLISQDAKIATLLEAKQTIDQAIKEAPIRLQKAQLAEKSKRMFEAMTAYQALTTSRHTETANAAREAAARLEPEHRRFQASWEAAVELERTDLIKAQAAWSALAEPALQWGQGDEAGQHRTEMVRRLASAETDYKALGDAPDLAALETFITAHAGTPQIPLAKARADTARRQQQAREQSLQSWRKLMDERQYERAWSSARELLVQYGRTAQDAGVRIPLLVESTPPGAIVSVDGSKVGTSPTLITYLPGSAGTVTIEMAGHQTTTRPISELAANWRWQANLSRAILWQVEVGAPCQQLAVTPDGRLLGLTVDSVMQFDARGGTAWRAGLASDDLAVGTTTAVAHPPATLPDGRLIIGLPGHDVAVVSRTGQVTARWKTNGQVRGRPLVYVNDAFGIGTRVAWGAEVAVAGDPDATPSYAIPLSSAALSGPVAVPTGIDQILVFGTVAGSLLGVEESTKKVLWNLDLRASDIGQLQPVGKDGVITLVDSSRLVRLHLDGSGATVRWSHQMADAPQGEPVIAGGIIHISVVRQLVRVSIDGAMQPPLTLPSQAATAPACRDDMVVVGCKDRSIAVFRAGRLAWTTPCPAVPVSVATIPNQVVVALADGSVLAYPW